MNRITCKGTASDRAVPLPSIHRWAKVSIFVLTVTLPLLLNGKQPATILPVSDKNLTECICISTTTQQTQNIPDIGKWRILGLEKILMHRNITGNGAKYHMIFTTTTPSDSKVVHNIYLIKDGSKGSNDLYVHPPCVARFTYHNIGKDKEFCSVRVHESIIGKDGNSNGVIIREIKIDDDAANQIIRLLTGNSQWKNMTMVPIYESNSAKLMEPQIRDF